MSFLKVRDKRTFIPREEIVEAIDEEMAEWPDGGGAQAALLELKKRLKI